MTARLFELFQNPFVQVLLFVLLTVMLVVIYRPKNSDKTWVLAGLVFIGFMFINSIGICTAHNVWTYFFYSLGYSMLYLVSIAVVVPVLIKILKIEGTSESAMIFIFIIYHPFFLLIMGFLKWAYFKIG
jgi:hypothetical protein